MGQPPADIRDLIRASRTLMVFALIVFACAIGSLIHLHYYLDAADVTFAAIIVIGCLRASYRIERRQRK